MMSAEPEEHPKTTATVRAATLGDIAAIQKIGLLTWPATYLPISSPDYVLDGLHTWWSRESIARSITEDRTWIATVHGEPTGMSTLGVLGDEPVIWKMYVLPDRHGQGIGTQLMAATLAGVPRDGDVLIEFVEGNERARRFYERIGFEPDRTEPGEHGTTTLWYRRKAIDT